VQESETILELIEAWAETSPLIARFVESLGGIAGLSALMTFLSILGGFGAKLGVAIWNKLTRWLRLKVFLRPRKLSTSFTCTSEEAGAGTSPEQIEEVRDLRNLADFHCLIVRYGLDSYLRDVATTAEIEDAKRQLKIVPCIKAKSRDGDFELRFRIRIHPSLGTQFKCYAQARLLKPWRPWWLLPTQLQTLYKWVWFKSQEDKDIKDIVVQNRQTIKKLYDALIRAQEFGCISDVSRSQSVDQTRFYFIIESWAVAPTAEERVEYNAKTNKLERAARVLNNYIYPT
jgi:hypothetical protein